MCIVSLLYKTALGPVLSVKMMRLFITTILIVCFSAISAAAKGGIETTVTRLKCISTFSDYLHSGEITLTVAENFDVYINDPYRYTGEMVYNGEVISDGKLKQVKWSGKKDDSVYLIGEASYVFEGVYII